MDIIRQVNDGAEFFTVVQTGRCGTSITGAARLNGIARQSATDLIDRVGAGKIQSEALKPFLGKDVRVQLTFEKRVGSHTQIIWLDSDFVAAMTEYYAFEAKEKKAEAIFTYRKFAKMGITQWIHGITGWKPPQVEDLEDPKIILPNLELSREAIRQIIDKPLSPSSYRLYLHLHDIGQLGQRPTIPTICKHLKISHTTFYKTARKLKDLGLLPDWLILETRNYPESFVRDWLHRELGGQIEAPTPYGPIDLLTDDSVIEVKAVEDWKEAIGHVMVKVAAHPQHTPCLMLFGDKVKNFDRIRQSCQRLKIELGCLRVKYIYNGDNELQEVQRLKVYL